MYVCCVCSFVQLHMCGGHKLISGVFLCYSELNFVRQSLSMNLECTNNSTKLASQKFSGVSLSLPSITQVTDMQHGTQLLHGY